MMEEKQASVPYYAHEGMMARNERTIKKLIVSLVITIVLMFASNAIWLFCWMQYDYAGEEETISVDGGNGITNYVGNDGDIENGPYNSNEE